MNKIWNETHRRLLTRFQLDPEEYGESLTVQSSMPGSEIKNILNKYTKGTLGETLDIAEVEYRDVSTFTDFADVMRTAKDAEYQFMQLPSKLREIFDHDVGKFLDTAHDKDKRDALVSAGYLEAVPADDLGSDLGDVAEGGTAEVPLPSD